MVLIEYLSPSKINKYYGCAFSFYCEYIDRKPQIRTPDSASFGSMVHNIIVNYYTKIGETATIDDVVRCVDEAFVEGTDYRLFEGHKLDVKKTQESFRKWEINRVKQNISKPVIVEKALKAELFPGLPPIEGRIDAYHEDIATWIDWKTGKYEEMSPERMVQGKIYELLLIENGYPVKEGKFVNLAKDSVLPLPKITNGWIENKVRTMVSRLEKGIFPPTPSPLCNGWCGYRLACDLRFNCPWKYFNR